MTDLGSRKSHRKCVGKKIAHHQMKKDQNLRRIGKPDNELRSWGSSGRREKTNKQRRKIEIGDWKRLDGGSKPPEGIINSVVRNKHRNCLVYKGGREGTTHSL